MLKVFRQYYPIRNAIFVFGEGILILFSVIVACWIILEDNTFRFESHLISKALLITLTCQLCLYYNDLYNLKITDKLNELGVRLIQALGAAAIILAIIYIVFPNVVITQGIFLVSMALVIMLIVSWRIGYTFILNHGFFNEKIILIGESAIAQEIYQQINEKRDCGYQIVSIISNEGWNLCSETSSAKFICIDSYESICDIALSSGVKKVIVALKEKRGALPVKELLLCRVNGIEILDGNSFFEMLSGKLIVDQIDPSWLIFSNGFRKTWFKRFVKRTFDLIISLCMIIVLAPFLLLIAIIIKVESKGPVLFSQERVGQNHKSYMVHKFRSMRVDAEKDTGPVWAQLNDNRITRVGKFIRKWRIDEIPQLWNILKGEMSFVGPRPEREYFVKQLTATIPYYSERFTVKPGLTGWAQVSYGYGASVQDAIEKLNYDLFYIKNLSILMDLMIVAKTVKTVLFGKGR